MMSHEMEAVKEILKGIKLMVQKAMENTTKIYDGIIVSEDANGKWNVKFNGEIHKIKNIGYSIPRPNIMVKVFVPQGNYSLAWFEVVNTSPYPVGAIYISVSEIEPSLLFGGEWERIEGRFLLGTSVEYSVGEMKGEATHTLTIDEMPSHNHSYSSAPLLWKDLTEGNGVIAERTTTAGTVSYTTDSRGEGLPHNNMPPYLAVYMWKRTK